MKYCTHCGNPYPQSNAKFCGFCGAPTDPANNTGGTNKTSKINIFLVFIALIATVVAVAAVILTRNNGAGAPELPQDTPIQSVVERPNPEDVAYEVFAAACSNDADALFSLFHPKIGDRMLESAILYERYESKEDAKREYCEHQQNRYYFRDLAGVEYDKTNVHILNTYEKAIDPDSFDEVIYEVIYDEALNLGATSTMYIEAKYIEPSVYIEAVIVEIDNCWYLLEI